MSDYQKFLGRKAWIAPDHGVAIDPAALHRDLKPFQRAIVGWALRKGRAAVFADTGLGKTLIQLEWATRAGNAPIILAPLAVAQQTVGEAAKWGHVAKYCQSQADVEPGIITVTNYERLAAFDAAAFDAVVLDESSILKSYEGKVRTAIIETFGQTPYRLACTATPAPNDIAEIANHAEFLGLMTRAGMLATYFVHDQDGWRLKRPAEREFYRWMASWAVFCQKPSDLGDYDDTEYDLPPLTIGLDVVPSDYIPDGQLVAVGLKGVGDRSKVRKATLAERVRIAAERIASEPDQQWLAWCGLNDEGDALVKAIPGAVMVTGSDSNEYKTLAAQWFAGDKCVCNEPLFRAKLTAWNANQIPNTSENTTSNTVTGALPYPANLNSDGPQSARNICEPTTSPIQTSSSPRRESSATDTTPRDGPNTPPSQSAERKPRRRRATETKTKSATNDCGSNSGSAPQTMTQSSPGRGEDALSAAPPTATDGSADFMLTTAIQPESSGDCSVPSAILGSGSLGMTPPDSTEPRCICGHVSGRRILISKVSIFGMGMNFQSCARQVFVGLGDSYEQYYQAIRRCWRFGQAQPVNVHIILTDIETEIYANVLRKQDDFQRMRRGVMDHVSEFQRLDGGATMAQTDTYRTDDASGNGWRVMLGDSAERIAEIPDASVDLSIFSPPFLSLFQYSNSERDMGNCKTAAEFWDHFRWIRDGLLRVMKPGRNVCVHVAQVGTTLAHHGTIGLQDFRGMTIAHFTAGGFIYHGDVVVDKDPQAQAIRTHSKALLFVQKEKDSAWLRPALADYIIVFRAPGENETPIKCDLTNNEWIEWARPIWYGIKETDTLNTAEGKGQDDERHICPLQLGTIHRCVRLWSNPGETVFSPFAGIGSELYEAIKLKRRALGIELKESYWRTAAKNCRRAESLASGDLFAWAEGVAPITDNVMGA